MKLVTDDTPAAAEYLLLSLEGRLYEV
jgi:hypothetical protein